MTAKTEADLKTVIDYLKSKKRLLHEAVDIANAFGYRPMGYTSRDYNYRRTYNALRKLEKKGVVGWYQCNQHNPIVWWLNERVIDLPEMKKDDK